MQSSRASESGERRERQHAAGSEARVPAAADEAAGPSGPGGSGEPSAREQELGVELARMEERYKRALADLENYRKRSTRETERRVEEARETLLRDWLEALDSVERALRMTPEDEGLRAVLAQMEAILARQGVTRAGAAGERFDPERHEAIGTLSRDGVPDRTIVEVARSGFALGDRVLRPAQVLVSARPEGHD